jgi:4-hydroxythreonine-4-phosphate dehydrogenase
LTPGDPDGIGPEVACRALAVRLREGQPVRAVVVGARDPVEREAARFGLAVARVDEVAETTGGVALYEPDCSSEPVEVASLRAAVAAIQQGRASGLVTGPIHKHALAARGFAYPGHTEFLGHLCGVERPVMAFVGGALRVALVTVHMPLREVPSALSADLVLHVLMTVESELRERLRLATRRIAVCGLNPHAGEEGLLGREELEIIAPAVERARTQGVDARGPVSAETAFRWAADARVDLVVAMYHDQGLAPLKLVDFGRSVNWTLGLPIVRTSVDHGTARDIAGKGVADASSMGAAIRLAEALVLQA